MSANLKRKMNSFIIIPLVLVSILLQVTNGLICHSCGYNSITDPPQGDIACHEEPDKTLSHVCGEVEGNTTYCMSLYGTKDSKVIVGRLCSYLPNGASDECITTGQPDGYDIEYCFCKTDRCNNEKFGESEISTPESESSPDTSPPDELICHACMYNDIADPTQGDISCHEDPDNAPSHICGVVPGSTAYCLSFFGTNDSKVTVGRSCFNLLDGASDECVIIDQDGYQIESCFCKTDNCNNQKFDGGNSSAIALSASVLLPILGVFLHLLH